MHIIYKKYDISKYLRINYIFIIYAIISNQSHCLLLIQLNLIFKAHLHGS